jgi:hypothetical protein
MLGKMPRNEFIMNELFNFDPRFLEQTPSIKLSQFIIGLSQYLIFFSSQVNSTRLLLMQKRRAMESYIEHSDIKGKTKSEKKRKVIDSDEALQILEDAITNYEEELTLVDSLEKYYLELINSFKRELTRRDSERVLSSSERRV